MPAPKKNQFATKTESEKLSARITINLTADEKKQIEQAAGKEKLPRWARRVLVEAIKQK